MVSFNGDGVYHHCQVTPKMEKRLKKKLLFTWDPMYKAALIDTALRSGNKAWTKMFEWLVVMTVIIGKGVAFVAWGKSWKEFFDICDALMKEPDSAFTMKRPCKFSETKFADHAHEVYDKFRNNFKPLLIVLEKSKERKDGSSDEKKKAELADEVQGKIFNWLFVLSLSMVTDIYKVYRSISLNLQKIDILPHDKYDTFKALLGKFRKMISSVHYGDCPCMVLDLEDKKWKDVQEEVCSWPRYHTDVNIALDAGTYQGVNIGMMRHEVYRSRAGSSINSRSLKEKLKEVVEKVDKRRNELLEFIEKGLQEKVYSNHDVMEVENCRKILDVKAQAVKVKEHGLVKISSLHFNTFRSAALFFEPQLDLRVNPPDLRLQWRQYNDVLEEIINQKPNLSSIDFVKLLINPTNEKYYRGIEGVLSILVRAAVAKGGVESVCESMVSVVEAHTPALRAILNQRRLEDEIMVAWNGEDIYHCDSIVKEAMETYWAESKHVKDRSGHFIRRSEDIKSYVVSASIDSEKRRPAKLSIMNKYILYLIVFIFSCPEQLYT